MSKVVIYRVQVGAYLLKANADRMLKKLKKKGFNAVVIKSGAVYRVQVGAYTKIENAQTMQENLKHRGFKSIIVEYFYMIKIHRRYVYKLCTFIQHFTLFC